MQYTYYFEMLTGRQNASAAFLQYKKADLCFFPAFCNAKRRTFFLRWLFALKIGRKSVWSTFSHAQKVKPCFFLPFCIENTLSQKKTVVFCSKRKVRIMLVGIIAISPNEFCVFTPTCLVVPLSSFLQVFLHPKAFPIASGQLQCRIIPFKKTFIRMCGGLFVPFDGFLVIEFDPIALEVAIRDQKLAIPIALLGCPKTPYTTDDPHPDLHYFVGLFTAVNDALS